MRESLLRAGDQDREAVVARLREHHLAGRLDDEEFEQRMERCLSARTYAALGAITADLPGEHPPRGGQLAFRPARVTMNAVRISGVMSRLALLVAVLVFVIWALTSGGHGSSMYFWPAWVWLGLAIPFGFSATLRWAWRRPKGAVRQRAVVWTFALSTEALLIVIWALSSAGGRAYFWPVWPLFGFLALVGFQSVIARPAAARAELTLQVEDLNRSRRETVYAQDAELGRIERDLHDGAQARLVALSMQLGRAELQLEDQPHAQRLVKDAREEASRAISDLRDLSRGISPPLLADRGLVAAARALAARYDADVEISTGLEDTRLVPALERSAYFVVAEALTNAAKHAGAEHVHVRLALGPSELTVAVADDGNGGADPNASGLNGLRTRIEALGGTMLLTSSAGIGTSLEARFPTGS